MLLPVRQWVTINMLHHGESGSQWEERSPALKGCTVQTFEWHQSSLGLWNSYNTTLIVLRLKLQRCQSLVFDHELLHPAQGGTWPTDETSSHSTEHTFDNYFIDKITLTQNALQHLSEGWLNMKQGTCPLISLFLHPLVHLGGCTPFWDSTPDVCVRL